MQVIPYDFRICALYNDSPFQIKLSMKLMKKLFSKKSIIVGHSYGNNMIQHFFKQITPEEKESLVEEFVAIGPPFLGSLKPLFYMTGSESFLYYGQVYNWTRWKWLSHKFDGINSFYSAEMLPSLDLMFDMIQYPQAVEAHFNNFSNNIQILRENKAISEELLSSVYSDTEHVVTGNVVEKQYGEVPDFKGEGQ